MKQVKNVFKLFGLGFLLFAVLIITGCSRLRNLPSNEPIFEENVKLNFVLAETVYLTNENIIDIYSSYSEENNNWYIVIVLDEVGKENLKEMTAPENQWKTIEIIRTKDGFEKTLMCPVISDQLTDGKVILNADYETKEDADLFILTLTGKESETRKTS